jgi:hypothetical protein
MEQGSSRIYVRDFVHSIQRIVNRRILAHPNGVFCVFSVLHLGENS